MVKWAFHETIATLLLQLPLFFLTLENTVQQDLAALTRDQSLVVLRKSRFFGLILAFKWCGEAEPFIGYFGLSLTVDVLAESAPCLFAMR